MSEQSEQPISDDSRSELPPNILIVNKNKSTIAARLSSTFAQTGFVVEDQGFSTGPRRIHSADMFRDGTSTFKSELGNSAGHKIQLEVTLLDDLKDLNPLYRAGTDHLIKDDILQSLKYRDPADQEPMLETLDDPAQTFYVVKRVPAYQQDDESPKYDTYVIKGRFRSPTAEEASDKPIWTPPPEFPRKVSSQIMQALSEKVDNSYAQEVYKSSLRSLEDPNSSQAALPLFKTKIPKPTPPPEPVRTATPNELRLTPRESINQLITKVRSHMSPAELATLPSSTGEYIDAIMSKALRSPEDFKDELAEAFITQYYGSPHGERFIRDPIRNGTLNLDGDGELVSLIGAEIRTPREGAQYIGRFDSYEVLTGPNKGKLFKGDENDRPIPFPSVPSEYLKNHTAS